MPLLKTCSACKLQFPATSEFWHKHQKQGIQSRFKQCACELARKWYTDHPDLAAINHANSSGKRTAQRDEKRRIKEAAFVPPTNRNCNVCHVEFPRTADFWNKQPRRTDGLEETCKLCAKKRAQAWYAANRARAKARRAEYWEAHRDQLLAAKARHRAANIEKLRAGMRAWKAANPEAVRADVAKYKARRKAAPGKITAKEILGKYAEQRGTCFYCPQSLAHGNYQLDHYMPLAKGGTNYPSNIVLACPTCNNAKRAKLPSEFKPKSATA